MRTPLFLFLLFVIQYAGAQDTPRITLVVDSATFNEVIDHLEKQTVCHFFYKKEWVSSFKYSFALSQQTLEQVLDTLVQNTELHYYIANHQVFITNKVQVVPTPKITELLNRKMSGTGTNVEKGLVFIREYSGELDNRSRSEDGIFEIGSKKKMLAGGSGTVVGYVKDIETGQAVSGVLVYTEKSAITTHTDESGFYSLTLPVGKHALLYQSVSMKPARRNVTVFSNGVLNIEMKPDVRYLQEVLVKSNRGTDVENIQMGVRTINVNETKNIPMVLGERDVMKIATTLAGIKTVGEGAAGFNVRGGKSDQNLVTLDGAPIYNTSHFLGFFSAFNSDAIEDVKIYTGSIPAKYGGRLSSVMDISSRSANHDSVSGSGGISPVTSRLTVEVPLFKGRSGLMVGGRTTYSNWILKKIKNAEFSQNRISFSDFILRHHIDFNPNNKILLSGYYSVDNFRMSSDTLFSAPNFRYRNRAASFSFLHRFSPLLSSMVSVIYSGYGYDLSYDASAANAFTQDFDISEWSVKTELNYSSSDLNEISVGVEIKKIKSNPGTKSPLGDQSIVLRQGIAPERGLESAAFLSDVYNVTPNLSLDLGLRYSMFTYLGSQTVYDYLHDAPKNNYTRVDSTLYGNGENIKTYHGMEPRFSVRFKMNNLSSFKIAYNRTRQYIHTLTNSSSLSPTDIWRLSGSHLKPQLADQFSAGYYRNFDNNKIEASVEVYHKEIENLLDFKVGSRFLLNPNVETATLQGPGKSYGLEIAVKKSGRLNGWFNYTYARTLLKLNSKHPEERINEGAYYPAHYDIPHAINMVANYKVTHRVSVSYNFSFKSGRPVSYPQGVYDFQGSLSVHYSDRNTYRIPNYMRMDIGVNLEAGHKKGKLAYSYWSFSIYNVLGRDNPYSVFFTVERNQIKGYKLVVFGTPIPTITYNFKF